MPEIYHALLNSFLGHTIVVERLMYQSLRDVAQNIAIFMALGWSLASILARETKVRALAIGMTVLGIGSLLSFSLELIQLSSPTRLSDIADVLWNSVGSALGAAMALTPDRAGRLRL